MVSSKLPEPVLCVALDAVEKIQGGEEAIGALWSVFTKVKDSVTDGHRLENMSWRLWHRARITPQRQFTRPFSRTLPGYPEILPRPLSSPALSFSSSSEATSSDWDRDTAIGDDEESHSLNISGGARRSSVVSPLTEKTRLDLVPGTDVPLARASQLPSPASSSRSCHQLETSPAVAHVRISPSAPSDYPPQDPADFDAGTDACREGTQDISLSGSHHQGVKTAQPTAGLEAPSSTPHESISPRTFTPQGSTIASNRPSTFSRIATTTTAHPSDSNISHFATGILAAAVSSSSMPITLPSGPRKGTWSMGRIIAELFPDKGVASAPSPTINRTPKVHPHKAAVPEDGRASVHQESSTLTPLIIEPQPPTPPSSRASTSSWVHLGPSSSPSPNSAVTSATSTPRQTFPTVVVVNPTPHPTPPATPSPGATDAPFGLRPFATPFDRPDTGSDDWKGGGTGNGQLATPVSLNGDARSSSEPKFVMVESKTLPVTEVHRYLDTTEEVTVLPLHPSLLPAAAITLPEKPTDMPTSSHLPTPSSDSPHALQASQMANSSKAAPAPIPAPAPSEEKKFFLAAPHSGSGGSGPESSESPGSFGMESVSPDKSHRDGMGQVPMKVSRISAPISHISGRQAQMARDEELASSMSVSSPPGPAASVTSSRGGSSRHKARPAFSVATGSRRKQGSKKVVSVAKQAPRKDAEVDLEDAAEVKSKEQDTRTKAKGKEREVGERAEVPAADQSTVQPTTAVESAQQHSLSHPQHQQQSQNLRQLPTNPPRLHSHDGPRPSYIANASTNPPSNTKQLPYHPQLGHAGLGHLPTVPPRQRRPIEITETSSEYETTDTDESSWESESGSDDEACEDAAQADPRPEAKSAEPSTKKTKASAAGAKNRTRDAGEFVRDAALEAQRQKELFQKLPSRSYSHLSQLPRTQSGLSQLFRPDPALFPDGHPYRTSRSSRDILARNWSAPAPPLALTSLSKRGSMAGPMQASVNAEPVVSSVNPKVVLGSGNRASGPQRGYRPRGKPEGQEEETESEDDDPEDTIQVASSVAQRRLAALMGQRPATQQRPPPARSTSHPDGDAVSSGPQPASRTTTMPVLMHPYLPDPAPLQTPHTVRRNIISQELDEELRRNLLWERSQNQIQGRPARAPGSILPGPWRALTAVTPEEPRETQSNASDRGPGTRPFATQRTKSWAGDYHASGW